MRLLLIDDNALLLRGTARLLERAGFEVFRSHGWIPEIPALLGMVDAVVTDWDMPGANGLDVLRECRQLAPNLPVFVFSAEDDQRVHQQAIAAGAVAWITKPDLDQLALNLNAATPH